MVKAVEHCKKNIRVDNLEENSVCIRVYYESVARDYIVVDDDKIKKMSYKKEDTTLLKR